MFIMKSLNILCFGDSITAGAIHGGAIYHPYAESMLESLENAFPLLDFTADVQGLPGNWVTSPASGFPSQMDILYEEKEISYNWVVILGGINDLNHGIGGEDIYEALKEVWACPLQNGTKVLALTVHECASCPSVVAKRREILNDLILGHQEKNFYSLDLASKMPYEGISEEERKDIWDDGVHFTEKGYDLMGMIIAKRLIELISEVGVENPVQKPFKSKWREGNSVAGGSLSVR